MKLQEYNGYFVDYRLRQFRSNVPCDCKEGFCTRIEFVDFDSPKGRGFLRQMEQRGLIPIEEWSAIRNL